MEFKNAKYQFGVENMESETPNLRYIGLFSQLSFQSRAIVKHCSFYIQLKWSQLRSMLIFYNPSKHKKATYFECFRGGTKGNINPKWVKQQQYLQERHNLMLLTWNASSSFVKQNDCKNKTTWLNHTALSKSFSLFHTTYIEDIK